MTNNDTFHDYVRAFQYDEGSLHKLISYELVKEKNARSNVDVVFKLKINDKKIHNLLHKIKSKYYWINDNDIESWFLSGLFGDKENKGILHKVDLSFTPQQLINWTYQRLDGHIKNKIEDEQLFNNNEVESEVIQTKQDEEDRLSKFDSFQYNNWKEQQHQNTYEEFLEQVGGIKQFLSEKEYKIYMMLNAQNATEKTVANELGVSQQAVNDTKQRAKNKVKKAYLTYKQYRDLAKDNGNTYQIIKTFLEDFDEMVDYDVTESLDYFGIVINRLKKYQTKSDNEIDFEHLQQNKIEYNISVIDVLIDNLLPAQQELVANVLQSFVYNQNDSNLKLTKAEKRRFVQAVYRSFNIFIKDTKKIIEDMSDNIVDLVDESKYQSIANILIS